MAITIKEIRVKTTVVRDYTKTSAITQETLTTLKKSILNELKRNTDIASRRKNER